MTKAAVYQPFSDVRLLSPDALAANGVNFSTDVIYQIMTDRFHDGDPGNNPTGDLFLDSSEYERAGHGKYCGGDWQGIINKIEDGYLTDLGITAIWISPPVENILCTIENGGRTLTSYHGFWARDYKRTNPYFGSFEDFRRLTETAHRHQMKLVIDFAPNHTSPASSDHPWFGENGRLYDDGRLIGGYTGDEERYFLHNGGTDFLTYEHDIYQNLYDLANLNLIQPEIDQYLKEAIELWLGLGIDGIRIDAAKHVPFAWLKSFVSHIMQIRPIFIYGEWYLGPGEQDPRYEQLANESGMSLLDFGISHCLRQIYRKNGTASFMDLARMLRESEARLEHHHDQVTFLDNHDMERFYEEGMNRRGTDQALALMLTLRGVPCIYYGTEQYMTGGMEPENRGMIPSFSRETRAYQIIRRLAALRKENPALAYGKTRFVWVEENVVIYERIFGDSVVLVAVNRDFARTFQLSEPLSLSLAAGLYSDELEGLLHGETLHVKMGGRVEGFHLKPGAVGIWRADAGDGTFTRIGHIGPKVALPGVEITVDGRGFGSRRGTIWVGDTRVWEQQIVNWSDCHIRFVLPELTPGRYPIRLKTEKGDYRASGQTLRVLSGRQTVIRFVMDEAYTHYGESIYLLGNTEELGAWNPERAIGPFFNEIEYQYPTWYYDVSVPVGVPLEFKFVKRDPLGAHVRLEEGRNHQIEVTVEGPAIMRYRWRD